MILFLLLGAFAGFPVGMLVMAVISLPHLNRVEEANARLRRTLALNFDDHEELV